MSNESIVTQAICLVSIAVGLALALGGWALVSFGAVFYLANEYADARWRKVTE